MDRSGLTRVAPAAVLRDALTRHLHLDDAWVVDVALATVVGNALGGDPLWLLLVSPPSSGKTELVQMFAAVETAAWLAEITENSFLSGLQLRTRSGPGRTAPKHSLLFRWTRTELRAGKPAVRVMLVQDLTGLITSRREKRDAVFGQLRQIYDGRLAKSTGVGDDLLWEGYLGLLGAVTPKYDDVAELFTVLGERFLLYRPLRTDPDAEARAAVGRAGLEWREEVAEIAAVMVQLGVRRLARVEIPEWAGDRLIALAQVTAAGRATVPREGYRRVIRVLPEPEGPARLVQQFGKLLRGVCAVRALDGPGEPELAAIAKVARDTMPRTRLVALEALAAGGGTKQEISGRTRLPLTTCEYLLQDLVALGIAEQEQSEPRGRAWRLAATYRSLIERAGLLTQPPPESRNVREGRTGNLEREVPSVRPGDAIRDSKLAEARASFSTNGNGHPAGHSAGRGFLDTAQGPRKGGQP